LGAADRRSLCSSFINVQPVAYGRNQLFDRVAVIDRPNARSAAARISLQIRVLSAKVESCNQFLHGAPRVASLAYAGLAAPVSAILVRSPGRVPAGRTPGHFPSAVSV